MAALVYRDPPRWRLPAQPRTGMVDVPAGATGLVQPAKIPAMITNEEYYAVREGVIDLEELEYRPPREP
jgi:hypothetical protein